ncbi:hypothetical protein AVEN_194422-1 [Araneus ventricosus]|uniref:Uncharacterized protein n=1 Tax=Araneus ventricosus TaxID=182803 RepID=A0A4Y2A736_ARAVE|nr:hypothetical protein AVEN_194422-1 [Araneus ventricosus]
MRSRKQTERQQLLMESSLEGRKNQKLKAKDGGEGKFETRSELKGRKKTEGEIDTRVPRGQARKIVKSKSLAAGNSYSSAVKKIFATVSTQWYLADIPSGTNFKPSASTTIISSPVNAQNPSPVPVSNCESTPVTADLNGFQLVANRKKLKKDSPAKTKVTNPIPTKDNISTHQSALKPFPTTKPTSVDIELLPMVVLPPLEKRILQSRESDADAEMSSSSASEGDTLEYNISENLEDSPAVISPPPSSKPGKANKYKNRWHYCFSVLYFVCFFTKIF